MEGDKTTRDNMRKKTLEICHHILVLMRAVHKEEVN
jgi:hypothetical protein